MKFQRGHHQWGAKYRWDGLEATVFDITKYLAISQRWCKIGT